MATLGADQSGLHTADAATDDRNFLDLLGFCQVVLGGLHCFGINGAASQAHGILQVLGIGVTLGLGEIEAAIVAADAGTDILQPLLNQLGNPFGVSQELAVRVLLRVLEKAKSPETHCLRGFSLKSLAEKGGFEPPRQLPGLKL